jgi:histidine triad (HIT) family protein
LDWEIGNNNQMTDCVFCKIAARDFDATDLTVFDDGKIFVLVSLYQKRGNHGHVLVIPKAHIQNIYGLPNDLAAPLMAAISMTATAVKTAFSADGIQIRRNNEPAAGQDVFHLHFHVIPWERSPGLPR